MTAAILLFCAVGLVAALSPAVDAFLSDVFAVLFAVGGGAAFVVWLVVELRDWLRWMGATDPLPRPARAKRVGMRARAGRQ